MKERLRKNIVLFAALGIILAAAFVFASTMLEALWYAPDTEVAAPGFEWKLELASEETYPARLRVPSLELDAHVQHLGINWKGNMATPNNFTDVGWYKYGPPPGFQGSAVFAGHVDNGLGLSGVFKKLGELSIGDEIFVETKEGKELKFRVAEMQVYPHDKVPAEILFARKDMPRLNLITCEGDWLQGERTYDKRLVVYAELVR